MNKNYAYFDSKNIKIFIGHSFENGCEYVFSIAISFRTDGADWDNQIIFVGDYKNKRKYFSNRTDAEKAAFYIAEKIEQLLKSEIVWVLPDTFDYETDKIYVTKYKKNIDLVVFDGSSLYFTSLNGQKNNYIDLFVEGYFNL